MNSPLAVPSVPPAFLVLRGSPSLSPFRLEKLQQALTKAHPEISAIDSAFIHFISVVPTSTGLTPEEVAVLEKLLIYGGAVTPETGGEAFLVLPRIGTISPWASKATNIAHNCGLEKVRRIERGSLFTVRSTDVMSVATRAAIIAAIHDPMTETVCFSLDGAADLFIEQAPAPLKLIPVMAEGKHALHLANTELGLALAADEIDYLFNYYQRIARDPTDVELMMFAQANSEHCRHKIFNASWAIDGKAQDMSLFAMIRNTHRLAPKGTVVAYSDNSAIMQGATIDRFFPNATGEFGFS